MSVRLRYAPSPTGSPHVGNLRTAIYSQPLVAALPGLMIFLTSISFNLPDGALPDGSTGQAPDCPVAV